MPIRKVQSSVKYLDLSYGKTSSNLNIVLQYIHALCVCRVWQHMAQRVLARCLAAHRAPGLCHDYERCHCRNHILAGFFSPAARAHHCHLRLSHHCQTRRHSQVHVQDCRHQADTGDSSHSLILSCLPMRSGTVLNSSLYEVHAWSLCTCTTQIHLSHVHSKDSTILN